MTVGFSPRKGDAGVGKLFDSGLFYVRYQDAPIKVLKIWKADKLGDKFSEVMCDGNPCKVYGDILTLSMMGNDSLSFSWDGKSKITPVVMYSDGKHKFDKEGDHHNAKTNKDLKIVKVTFADANGILKPYEVRGPNEKDAVINVELCTEDDSATQNPFHCGFLPDKKR